MPRLRTLCVSMHFRAGHLTDNGYGEHLHLFWRRYDTYVHYNRLFIWMWRMMLRGATWHVY